jgi:murein DD-endopeptidase MepM/ murein hydrolase activator NlpD
VAFVQGSPSSRALPKPPGAATTTVRNAPTATRRLTAPEPTAGAKRPGQGPVAPIPAGLHPKLTAGGYVFPVYGPASFSDDFGAPRADVSYHHGNDIFAQLGAPVLACADGIVFSVGWNDLGGNRLWLVDGEGNQFYYAHLSAYSPLAVNGKHVRAGEVLGFVGNTGDAEGTPYHLHFEVHPVEYLKFGYDGAVDPYAYLKAWKQLQDVRFTAVAGWAPSIGATGSAPRPGAILLQASDISEGSGLEPGSLERAMVAPASSEGDAALLRSATLTGS